MPGIQQQVVNGMVGKFHFGALLTRHIFSTGSIFQGRQHVFTAFGYSLVRPKLRLKLLRTFTLSLTLLLRGV